MLPEEKARVKIDKQLNNAGWDIVDRKDYLPNYAMAVKEALMQGGKESDYLLFVDNKAIGVVEAKKESDSLGPKVASQAEHYAKTPQNWYGLWFQGLIPLVYLANGNKIYSKICLLTLTEIMLNLVKCILQKRCCSLSAKNRNTVLCRELRKGDCVTASMMQKLI